MKLLDTIKTANSNLFRSKLRTFLTILAVFVGSLTLTLTTGLGEGIKDYINKQTNAVSLKDTLTVLPGAFANVGSSLTSVPEYKEGEQTSASASFLTTADIDAVKGVAGVDSAELLFIPKPLYMTREEQKRYKDDLLDLFVKNLEIPLAAGKLPDLSQKQEMILAYKFLEPLGFNTPQDALNQKVKYVFKNAAGQERVDELTIVGVQIDSLVGSQNRINPDLAKEAYQFQFNTVDASQYAFAYLKPNTSTEEVQRIKDDLKKRGYAAQTFDDQIKQLTGFINIMQTAVNAFGIIVILAASIGIVNTLLMAVYERTREVGLMKALGMRSSGIFSMFAFEAASIGFWGGVFGVLIAVALGTFLNSIATTTFLKNFEGFTLFAFPVMSIVPVILGTMLVGLLAGTLPALKASRLNPIEALRYE